MSTPAFWLDVVFIGLVCAGVVGLWLLADHLGNRWWQALPEPIRQKGLIRWLWQRWRG